MKIGFIGQGWIGKNYADDFENRGFETIRYSLEEPYINNKEKIIDCDIVFIAVPTPTTPEGFDISFVRSVLSLIGNGNIAVIKSTILPGTTEILQNEFLDIFVFHSPEFLVEKTATHDAAHPNRNIIGIPKQSEECIERAQWVLSVLPDSPYQSIMDAKDAEFVKYAGNCFLFMKVIYMNILYDLVSKTNGDWERIKDALAHDPRIGQSHIEPIHDGGRGAGGHCLIKDFETFRNMYDTYLDDRLGSELMKAMVNKNIQLLVDSDKSTDLLTGVYGDLNKYRLK